MAHVSGDKDSLGVRVALAVLRGYKLAISPYFRGSCRFLPTCADYAAIAIARHGLLYGVWLASRRLIRCHPLCAAGHDPVPPRHERTPEALVVSLPNHERPWARSSAFAEGTADRRSAKRGGWSTGSGRAS